MKINRKEINLKLEKTLLKGIQSKKAQLPFNWIFAIVVGAVIIFLALFFAWRYGNVQQYKYDTEIAEKLNIILNPLESFAEAKTTLIEMPAEARISLKCNFEGIGRQELRIATKSSLANQWQEFSAPQSIYNKYVFSNSLEEGRKLYVFGKKFSMPFQVSDLIYATMSDYCFVNPPVHIEDELKAINTSNFILVNSKRACRNASKSVCFGQAGCDINVYGFCSGFDCSNEYDYGSVEKKEASKGKVVYYSGEALLYAAVFSSTENYECNIDRLMYRIDLLSRLYREKAKLLESKGCGTGRLKEKLAALSLAANFTAKSGRVFELNPSADEVENSNSELICRVF